jgi:flagellar biosynthesis/type III secretory pathway chaperone
MSDERLEAAQRLVDLLRQENEALKRLDFPAAVALLGAKEAALADLEKPPQLPMIQPALAQRLGELAEENQVLLERAIAVQSRVVRIVARAYAPPPALTRYNGKGGRTVSTRATALALSTRV